MAKAPLPGQVKTRMQPELSPEQAARLARVMLEQSVETVCRHWPGEVTLCVWPNPGHSVFQRLVARYDLGTRMMTILKQGILRSGSAMVMGCDVPHIPPACLTEAHAMLVRGENPVGPADDGGFYLIGLHRADEVLFEGIRWGGSTVLDAVRKRAARAGVELSELPSLRDIDRYPDLQWLAGTDHAYQQFLSYD